MKIRKIAQACVFLVVGGIAGYTISVSEQERMFWKLNEWFHVEKALQNFSDLYVEVEPEKFQNYNEKKFLSSLRAVEDLTKSGREKPIFHWKFVILMIDDMGPTTLIKTTEKGLDKIKFSSEEARSEAKSILEKIKFNQTSRSGRTISNSKKND